MRVLGVLCDRRYVHLAVVEDGAVTALEPDRERLHLPELELSHRLAVFVDDTAQMLGNMALDEAVVLVAGHMPGTTSNHNATVDRAILETLMRLACDRASIPVQVLGPTTVRARLAPGTKGPLKDVLPQLLPVASGRYWKDRGLAALAALSQDGR